MFMYLVGREQGVTWERPTGVLRCQVKAGCHAWVEYQYPMEADSIEARTTPIVANSTSMESHFLPCKLVKASMEVGGRFDGSLYQLPWKCNLLPLLLWK